MGRAEAMATDLSNITLDNYFYDTFANFTRIYKRELPKREPDYISDSGSEYWYEGNTVYRRADHWGRRIATCNWILSSSAERGWSQGYCKLTDFKRRNKYSLRNAKAGERFRIGKTVLTYKGGGNMYIEIRTGIFKKQTEKFYVFDTFRATYETIAYVEKLP
jgi:hypothetical protein